MKCADLCKDTIRISGVHFLYIKTKQDENKVIGNKNKNSECSKTMWRVRSLTLEGKIIVFKTLAISKIVYLSIMIKIPAEIIVELEKLQKRFIWPSKSKIKNETISSEDGGLKDVDINKKIASL